MKLKNLIKVIENKITYLYKIKYYIVIEIFVTLLQIFQFFQTVKLFYSHFLII